ncbi:MAG: diacylglycerol kinase family protein [Candidatus Omnitrophota bacterium]
MLKKIWKHKNIKESFTAAFRGLKTVLKVERNARIIFIFGILSLSVAFFLKLSLSEFAIVIIAIASVFVAEIFNTLVEQTLDIVKPEKDPHIKILKDISSSAVLIICLAAAIVILSLFLPKMWSLVNL